MTHKVVIPDAGFAKDDWISHISLGLESAQRIEVEAIDVPFNCEPDPIFMPPHLQIIRIDFQNFSDGRGFTLARLIRLFGFVGQLRAKGCIIADQYAIARRSGFDEVEISAEMAARQPEEQWLFRSKIWQDHYYQARMWVQ